MALGSQYRRLINPDGSLRSGSLSSNQTYVRKTSTLTADSPYLSGGYLDLGGHDPNPIAMFALGAISGFVFGVATTVLSSAQTQRVQPRIGDEIWKIETIGRIFDTAIFSDDSWVPQHIAAYFLVDPFRRNSQYKKGSAWLLHEERTMVKI
jgi:hypothetical protein